MPYAAESAVDDNSFPIYRRRDPDSGGSSFVNSKGLVVTNQWVVPYNKDILLLCLIGHLKLDVLILIVED